ncbi:PAS domain-containing protein [Novispirillum sp. DQ9]|uniref:PAS domain-containing protein n=1 Tax=Novispirillum sp. DQ9 TaxID=3398612 RepID=UPI003C7DD294
MMGTDMQHLLDALEGVTYVTDPRGVIVACGRPGWDRAVRLSDAAVAPRVEDVLGRSLFDFIGGASVRDSYRLHMERAAAMPERPRVFECRCDTPGLSRVIRMSIGAVRDDAGKVEGFLFQSVVVRTSERVPVALFAFPPPPARVEEEEGPFLGMCSYCQRVRFPAGSAEGQGEWIDAVEYYRRGGDNDVVISHGICPDCFEGVVQANLREVQEFLGR